jgi:hypothetical protein
MLRVLLHPLVLGLLLLLAIGLWMWAKRVNLRVRLARLPTRREWAVLTMLAQVLRWLLRLRL